MAYGRKGEGARRGYQYGLRDPIAGREAAIDSMHRRVALWNSLVEIEDTRRQRREALIAPFLSETMTEKEREAARRAAYREEAIKPQLAALIQERNEAARLRFREASCYTWQKDDLQKCWAAACDKPDAPRIQRFRPYEGVCALRWQTGLPVATALAGSDTLLQLRPAPPSETADPESRRSRKRTRMLCRFRVDSSKRKPVWFEAPFVLHRPLPPEALIRSAYLKWRRVGPHVRWSLSLVLQVPDPVPANRSGRVALNLGWRLLERGLRVGYLLDENDAHEEVLLDLGWIQQYARAESIQQHRKVMLNETLGRLSAFRAQCGENAEAAWFLEETRFLHLWKATKRPARLALAWREHRFAGDEEMFRDLEAWRKHDKHHWAHEGHLRDQLIAQRREIYRNAAIAIARRYGKLRVEDFDLRRVARVKADAEGKPGAGKELAQIARHQRHMAAPSELRSALVNACEREGLGIEKVPTKNITMTCPACGRLETPTEFDKAREVIHACVGCGTEYDQDYRACKNLLAYVFPTPEIAEDGQDIGEGEA